MKKLWYRFITWFRFWWLKGGRVTQANAGNTADKIHDMICSNSGAVGMSKTEFRKEFTEIVNPQSMRDELCDIILDRQLDRARAFGQAHRAKRGR